MAKKKKPKSDRNEADLARSRTKGSDPSAKQALSNQTPTPPAIKSNEVPQHCDGLQELEKDESTTHEATETSWGGDYDAAHQQNQIIATEEPQPNKPKKHKKKHHKKSKSKKESK